MRNSFESHPRWRGNPYLHLLVGERVCVLHNLPPNTTYVFSITCPLILLISPAAILNLPINLFWPLDTTLAFPFNFPSIPSSFLQPRLVALFINSHGAIFIVCSHTFTLFWLRKTYVIVEIYQISFRVFVCAFPLKISPFFFHRVICTSVLSVPRGSILHKNLYIHCYN